MTTQSSAQRILSLIDLTNLNDDCTEEDVVELCSRAQGEFGNTAAVCVWPRFVNLCASILRGTSIKVATVVNFPHGGTDVADVVATTIAALDAGADEIDLVLPYQSMIIGDEAQVLSMLQAVREVVHAPAHLKVILETGATQQPLNMASANQLAADQSRLQDQALAQSLGALGGGIKDIFSSSSNNASINANPAGYSSGGYASGATSYSPTDTNIGMGGYTGPDNMGGGLVGPNWGGS